MITLVITFTYFNVEPYVDKIYWDRLACKLIAVIRKYRNGKIIYLDEKGEPLCS